MKGFGANTSASFYPLLLSMPYLLNDAACLACTCKAIHFAMNNLHHLWTRPLTCNGLKILIVGDGNLSFSLSLAHFFNAFVPEANIVLVATTFDERETLLQKYPETEKILAKLHKCSRIKLSIKHRINAVELPTDMGTFTHIYFQHPHLGIEDSIQHEILIAHFFSSCATNCLDKNGTILVTLVQGQASRWNVLESAKRLDLRCAAIDLFRHEKYSFYEPKRNACGRSFKNTATKRHAQSSQKSLVYSFCRVLEVCFPHNLNGAEIYNVGNFRNDSMSNKKRKAQSDPRGINSNDKAVMASTTAEYQCEECGKCFVSAQGVKSHTHMVHRLKLFDRSKTWVCTPCDRTFSIYDAFFQHNIAKHSEMSVSKDQTPGAIEKSAQSSLTKTTFSHCKICSHSFEGTYSDHLSLLQPIVEKSRFMCRKHCTRGFINERARSQHEHFCAMKTTANKLL
mgnify:CR=1 FL=1|jgi:hypothetical protein